MRKNCQLYVSCVSGFTLLELIVVVGIASLLATILLPGLRTAKESSRKTSCMTNMKELHRAFRIFADENPQHLWPAKAPARENFMFDFDVLYPEYLDSLEVLFCPSDHENPVDFLGAAAGQWRNDDGSFNGDLINGSTQTLVPRPNDLPAPSDVSYIYTGWAFMRPELLEPMGSLLLAYDAAVVDGKLDQDLAYLHPGNSLIPASTEVTLHRLRDGMGRFFVEDLTDPSVSVVSESQIAVLWDNFGSKAYLHNHLPLGANVLYMDGHVEFVSFDPETRVLPLTQTMGEFIEAARASIMISTPPPPPPPPPDDDDDDDD